MKDKAFIDTNILVNSYSSTEPEKQMLAQQCIADSVENSWISTQVLNELNNVLYRKFSLPYDAILSVMNELSDYFQVALVSPETIRQALMLGERYQYSYFDNLMSASALEQGCNVIYSEDMQNGQQIIGQLEIINPFAGLKI